MLVRLGHSHSLKVGKILEQSLAQRDVERMYDAAAARRLGHLDDAEATDHGGVNLTPSTQRNGDSGSGGVPRACSSGGGVGVIPVRRNPRGAHFTPTQGPPSSSTMPCAKRKARPLGTENFPFPAIPANPLTEVTLRIAP